MSTDKQSVETTGSKYELDHGLLLACARYAGANVHDVNAKKSAYLGWAEIANRPGAPKHAAATADEYAISLRHLLAGTSRSSR